MLGIAITTFNRGIHLDRLLTEVKRTTVQQHFVVVCDDGSQDNTESICNRHKVPRVGGKNMGIAWNKNRALYALFERKKCEAVIIMEDDIAILKDGWDLRWREAISIFGHVNFLNDELLRGREGRLISGDGSYENPFIAKFITGPCMGIAQECFEKSGYFHPDFIGYGEEHIEFTRRCGRYGFGTKDGGYVHINEGLDMLSLPSMSDKSAINVNIATAQKLKDVDGRVNPFLDKDRKRQIEDEVRL